jgi:DHA1 family multidrug resistance protein-like MFS transporter
VLNAWQRNLFLPALLLPEEKLDYMGKSVGERAAPIPTTRLGSRQLITLYAVVVFLFWISLYLYVPTLPTYAESKSENLALVGVVLAQYGLWQGIVRLPVGIAADWLGRRKPFIVTGIALAGLGALAMGRAGDVNGLIVGRAITGLAAATWVPLVAVFSSLFPPREAVRASAVLSLINSVGRVLATSVTGWLNGLGGYSLAFLLATGVAALAFLVALPAREDCRPPQQPSIGGTGRLITRRDVLLPSVLSAVAQYVNWGTTFGFLPVLAGQLGGTDVTQSMLASMHIGLSTVGGLVVATIVSRIGPRRLVYFQFVLLSLGVGIAALASSLPLVFAAQFCIGLSTGVGYPVLMGMSIEKVVEANRTTAMGLHQAVYAIGMFAGPGLSGILADAIGIRPMFGVTAFVCLALGLFITRWLGVERGG